MLIKSGIIFVDRNGIKESSTFNMEHISPWDVFIGATTASAVADLVAAKYLQHGSGISNTLLELEH